MTISNTANSITVTGDSLVSTFNYDFYMGGSASNAVLVFKNAAGEEAQVTPIDFSITGVTSSTGGTFTYPLAGSPITAGESLTLYRILPIVQNVAIANQGNFYPSVVEGEFDNLTMISQQLVPVGDYSAPFLAGNPTTIEGVFRQITLGSGLSMSGNSLVVSGVSGSGSVTQINTGTGLTGGPITGVGTVSMSTITTGFMLANFSGATAAPQGVEILAGGAISLSSTTTSLVISTSSAAAIQLISGVMTTGSTTSVTFSSITSSFRHLEIVIGGRGTTASLSVAVDLRFNGNTASVYYAVIGVFNGGSASSAELLAQSAMRRLLDIPAASATANFSGGGTITIPNYTGTFFKHAYAIGGLSQAVSSNSTKADSGGGIWASTASITSVTVMTNTGGFVDGTAISLYGRQ